MAREELEKKEHVFQIYFTGCGGDVLTGKYNDHTPAARDEFRARLLRAMEAAIVCTKFAPAESIQWRTVDLKLPLYTAPAAAAGKNGAKAGAKWTRGGNRSPIASTARCC